MKKVRVNLSGSSIESAIKELERYKKYILSKTEELLIELAKEGVYVATVEFGKAVYDGTNDVEVRFEQRENNKAAVIATGNATLFIEFGTGINYPDSHPLSGESNMKHGEFGHKLGRLPNGWRYQGDAGTNGEVITQGKYAGWIKTKGNPANMSMYTTERELEQKFTEIAKRVFKND